jgi:hypothetical protein
MVHRLLAKTILAILRVSAVTRVRVFSGLFVAAIAEGGRIAVAGIVAVSDSNDGVPAAVMTAAIPDRLAVRSSFRKCSSPAKKSSFKSPRNL